MLAVQRERESLMTDRLDCPDCAGTGEQRFTGLTLACRFCCGRGYVGDDYEPAEDPDPEDFPPAEATPWWDKAGAENFPAQCRQCMGAGVVVDVGDINQPSKLVEAPCPACTPAGKR